MTRLLPGAAGADSPAADTATSVDFARWLCVDHDRANGLRSPLWLLADALGVPWPDQFEVLWDRPQPGGVLTHRAAVVGNAHGARTLVSGCGFSRAWDHRAAGDVRAGPSGPQVVLCTRCHTPERR